MPDLTPIEKLQPCLLDRLTDDAPDSREESRSQRVVNHQRYRRGVLRDLEWLFNTNAYISLENAESFQLKDYPEAYRSVINYGIRQLCGSVSLDIVRLREEVEQAVQVFEPRISARSLIIHANKDRGVIVIEVVGDLWAGQQPDRLHLKTIVDIENGQCLLGDAPYG